MPDLLTHAVAARIPAGFLRRPSLRLLFFLGTFLPDLISKFLKEIVRCNYGFNEISHSLLGLVPFCYLIVLLFPEAIRRSAFLSLYVGSLLHLTLDLMKDSLGGGGMLLLPLSSGTFEWELYQPDNVIYLIPLDIVLFILMELAARRARQRGYVWQ